MKGSQIDNVKLNGWMEAHTDEMIRDIGELVAIRSVSEPNEGQNPYGEGCKKVLDKGLEIGSRLGFFTQNHENHCGSALWKGEISEEIGIFGHLDVVPEGIDWTHKPFELTVKDGFLIGRGVADDKGPTMAGFYGVKFLMDMGYQPKHSIRVYLGCNEEKGMADIKYYLRHNPMPRFSLVPDGSFPVCNGEKGILVLSVSHPVSAKIIEFRSGEVSNAVPAVAYCVLNLPADQVRDALTKNSGEVVVEELEHGVKVTARGVAAHAAYPEGSVNAMAKLAGVLARSGLFDGEDLECLSFLHSTFGSYHGEGLDVYFRDKTGYVTHIGGMTEIKGGRLHQNINIRYPMGITAEQLVKNIAAVCGKSAFTVDWTDINPPTFIPAEDPVIAMLNDLANDFLDTNDPPYAMGFTYARHLKSGVSYGTRNIHEENPMSDGHGGVHQPDECVSIASLLKAACIYARAIFELDQML